MIGIAPVRLFDIVQAVETLEDRPRRHPIHIFLQNFLQRFGHSIFEDLDPVALMLVSGSDLRPLARKTPVTQVTQTHWDVPNGCKFSTGQTK
ncbi:hypothetical protein HYPP_03277 [Hyphomicrobium sp. ghe19]|nr:hypothetical protein HYPP_03277 [Hyphomicrobium sp. ghe19]